MAHVLQIWKGLGYNRRALNLRCAAQIIVSEYNGKLPKNYDELVDLPGIGNATAGDILAFAWNIPNVVIETNIRSVFIHYFFKGKSDVHDRDILPLIEQTLDKENSREWYFALMDYGAMLKKTVGNASRSSKHYAKQSTFKGSHRQLRGEILKILGTKQQTVTSLKKVLTSSLRGSANIREGYTQIKNDTTSMSDALPKTLLDLEKEGFIEKRGRSWYIHGA